MSICTAAEIIFTAPRVTAVVSEATTGIPTEITTIDSIDKQGNPTSLQVLMPNWDQISFSTMPGVLSDGGFEDTSLNQVAGYDISRRWQAGQTPDQYLKLGDISEALRSELFSLNEIASITDLDLQQVALSAFPLVEEQTLEHLADIVPELGKQLVEDVEPIADLVEDVDVSLRQLQINELLQQNPDIGKLKLKAIDLDRYSLTSIPNLDSVALEKFTDWENSFIDEVPGLGQVPLSLYPNPIAEVGNIVARIDMAYSKAEADRRNTISGSNVEGFNIPCGKNCAYIELDNLENQGRSARASFEGKQWISGKYQKVRGGFGACGRVNGGKEPTGRLPFGETFKVVVWDVDETTDTVDTALFFRISCGWMGKTPYIIGPVPFFSYKVNAPIFVGVIEPSLVAVEASESQTSNETLSGTVRVTENAARLSSAANDVVSGVQVAGISVDALAEAIASVESSGNDRAVGPYTCADNSTNCGRALGKYQYMSYDPDVQAIIAAKPEGEEFLEQLRSGKPVTEDQVFEFFPIDDQNRLFEAKIAAKIQQTSQEIDPTTAKPFAGQRLIERVAQKHFGGDRSAVDSTASDTLGETLYAYGKKVIEYYLQRAGIVVTQSPTTSAGVKANTTGKITGGTTSGTTTFPDRQTLLAYLSPADLLDYFGLGLDAAERIYIELNYKEGQEKDFALLSNAIATALDAAGAIVPGPGGGGLAFRAAMATSRSSAAAVWRSIPAAGKQKVYAEVAKILGWSTARAIQATNVFFSAMNSEGGEGGGSGSSGSESTGSPQEPNLDNPPTYANETVRAQWKNWPRELRQQYYTAQERIKNGKELVRRMSEAEYRAIFDEGRGTTQDVFPRNVEQNKVFSLEREYQFSNTGRNTDSAYERVVRIQLTDQLKAFLRNNLAPDNLPGGLKGGLRTLPRYKLERGDYNIVIPKSSWNEFKKLIQNHTAN